MLIRGVIPGPFYEEASRTGVIRATIIVGIDGSAASESAARWAADFATSIEAEIVAVHALGPSVGTEPAMPGADLREPNLVPADDLDRWLAPIVESGVPCRTDVAAGAPAPALMARAESAERSLIVVGGSGHVRWGPDPSGGTALQLLRRSRRPICVVPHPSRAGEPLSRGVVVGVNGSPASRRALQWVVDQVPPRPLSLVRVVTTMSLELWSAHGPQLARTEGFDPVLDAHRGLNAFVVEAVGSELAARLAPEVIMGHAVAELTSAAESTSALVVGAPQRSGFGELLVGSVAQGCVARSRVPVIVVP